VRHEVAIYSASSGWAGFYDRSAAREGGAERQMTLLARALSERGMDVAHIIFPPREPVELPYPITLVYRPHRVHGGRILRGIRELAAVSRAFAKADGQVLVIRSASAVVAIGSLYCKLRGRSLIFSSSNISDFTLETLRPGSKLLYRLGLRFAAAVVVQSEEQRKLALRSFASLPRVVHIPSFAEQFEEPTGRNEPPEAFLWFGRSMTYKHPLKYVELARDVPEARFRMIVSWAKEADHLKQQLLTAAAGVPNLELIEPIPHPRLIDLIRRSVAVVNTSSLEGMPNAFLEAWSCGVPALTFQFDPDAVVARHRLGVAADGSWDRFVAGARELWNSRLERDDVAKRVRSYVRETHSPDVIAARWSELIEDVRTYGRAGSLNSAARVLLSLT
jgi:glycosyltransferase involved in cell wall biosynthesis